MLNNISELKMRRSTFGEEGSLRRREENPEIRDKTSRLSEPVRLIDRKSYTVPKLAKDSFEKENITRDGGHGLNFTFSQKDSFDKENIARDVGPDLDYTFSQKNLRINELGHEPSVPFKETNQKQASNNCNKRFSLSCEKSYLPGLEQSVSKRSKSDAHETLPESMSKRKVQLVNLNEDPIEKEDEDDGGQEKLPDLKSYSRHPFERESLKKDKKFKVIILLTIFVFLGASYFFKSNALSQTKLPSATSATVNLNTHNISVDSNSKEREILISDDESSRNENGINTRAIRIYRELFSRLSKIKSIKHEDLKLEILEKYAPDSLAIWDKIQHYQRTMGEIDIEIDDTTFDKIWVKK